MQLNQQKNKKSSSKLYENCLDKMPNDETNVNTEILNEYHF